MISFYVVLEYVVEVGLGLWIKLPQSCMKYFFLACLVYFNLIGFNYNFPPNNLSHRLLRTQQKRKASGIMKEEWQ